MANIVNRIGRAITTVGLRISGERATAADFRATAPPATTPQAPPLPGTKSTDGDFARAMLPEAIDPRSRRGQVIRVLASDKTHVAWQYVCDRCGTNNQIANNGIHFNRTLKCTGGCGKEFSIRGLAVDAIKAARAEANRTRGANIPIDRPISDEEWDTWLYTLPELIPSLETGREARLKNLDRQLNDPNAGEVEWTGSKYADTLGLDSGMGFANPGSGAWH